MTENLYPIGDVARRTGLSVSAIRYYADEGVIAPTDTNHSGHRFYDVAAITRLELVRTLRDLGAGLDDIRDLLAEDKDLHELATDHLGLVERQLRELRARAAVLRTIVSTPTPAGRVALLHSLVAMSDEERERLLDGFWTEVTDGLTVDPAFVEHLHGLRPRLPEDPATEQLQAWIELADLAGDREFRQAVREYLHSAFASPEAVSRTNRERLARLEAHRLVEVAAGAAERSGLAPDTPEARALAERLLTSMAGLVAGDGPVPEELLAELRQSLTHPEPEGPVDRAAEAAVAGFTGLLGRFLTLVAVINEDPLDEQGASQEWLAAALSA
ncbi:DNA-binding transcriptional MerR regulator [Crossiella equi]|uniref:DNA-binding transcriptional MerR regulator n=1 Tax=Crossiella equi TaxID=130796 RepID=A0ABS5AMT0_9PSEU|nr:MerR family transcriptional regulator [Crossiella equi]MBP2477010.1 DNA-binding transcriptional MerR regulator [Crossiella equi]